MGSDTITMQDFPLYFGLGWDHIISWDALDHLLFIAALAAIYVLKEWRQVLILVTAFTVGHSLTLALSVLDVVRFRSDWVEFLIPCTIMITALSNLSQKEITARSIHINYFLALFFGLIHGMGFANIIRFTLAEGQNIAVGLFGFNLGLEVGQAVVVVALLLMASLFMNFLNVGRRDWVILVSVGVFGLSLYLASERIPI